MLLIKKLIYFFMNYYIFIENDFNYKKKQKKKILFEILI